MSENTNIEIERRFILRNVPNGVIKNSTALSIEQFYAPSDKGAIRYRCTSCKGHDDKFEKIIKLPVSKGINTEQDFPVTKESFYKEVNNDMRHIAKTRYVLHYGMKFEVDVFQDFSLIILEVELKSLDEKIIFPEWLEKEIIAEITGMKEFSNFNMAR